MAVGFSYIQRELLSYVPIGFTQTRNFTVEKVKTTLPSGGWVHFLWGGGEWANRGKCVVDCEKGGGEALIRVTKISRF